MAYFRSTLTFAEDRHNSRIRVFYKIKIGPVRPEIKLIFLQAWRFFYFKNHEYATGMGCTVSSSTVESP